MADETEILFNINLGADQIAADFARIAKAQDELKASKKALTVATKEGTISEEEYYKELGEVERQQKTLSVEKGKATRDAKNLEAATKQQTGSLEQQRGVLRALTKEYDAMGEEQRENSARGKELKKGIDQLNASLLDSEKATGRAQRQVGFYERGLGDAASSINVMGVNLGQVGAKLDTFRQEIIAQQAATQASTTATSASSKSLRVFRLALIATGIGAAVVLIGALVGAFLSTQKGVDTVTRAFKPLQVAFERITGFIQTKALKIFESPKVALQDLGDFIIGQFTNRIKALQNIFIGLGKAAKAVFEGDFDAAGDALVGVGKDFVDLQTGVEGTVDALADFGKESLNTANSLDDMRLALRDVELRNARLIPQLRAQIEAEKLVASNTALSAKEREAAGKKALELLEQVNAAEQERVNLQIKLLEGEQKLSDTDAEGNLALAQLQAKRDEFNRDRLKQSKLIQGQINSAINQQINAEKKKQSDILAANTKGAEMLQNIRDKNRLAAITDEEKLAAEKLNIQEKFARAELELLAVTEELKNEIRLELDEQFRLARQELNDKYRGEERDKRTAESEAIQNQRLSDIEAEAELNVLQAEKKQEYNEALLELQRVQQENELLQFQGSEQEKLLLEEQLNEKKIALSRSLRMARVNDNIAIAQSFADAAKNIIELAGGNAKAQKAIALFQIGIDTAKGIAGAVAAGAGLVFPANLGAIASGISSVTAGIVSAKKALTGAPTFERGGALAFPAKTGGVIKGARHSEGGVPFSLGGKIHEAEGGELIINRGIWQRPDFVNAISEMNAATGGVRFKNGGITKFRDGGGVGASLRDLSGNVDVIEAIRALPAPVVTVEDINAGQQGVNVIESGATIL